MSDRRLKIGLFNDSFFPQTDGVISVVDNYARRLSRDHDVTVFVPKVKNFDDSAFPYRVVRCSSAKLPIIDYSLPLTATDRSFRKEVRVAGLDIVHIHSPFPIGKLGLAYAKKHSIPCVGTMHSQFGQDFYRATRNKLITQELTKSVIKVFDSCTECWAVNSEVARIYFEEYHCKKLPRVADNATDMTPVPDPISSARRIRELHSIPDTNRVVLFVGRLNKLKNVFLIADALALLKKSGMTDFTMLFVGSGQDEEELIHHVKKLELEDHAVFCGKVTDRQLLADYYSAADLFLFPSMYDASSIVQIEAASQKTPGIFFRGAATAATVTDGVNGFLSDPDTEAFAEKIKELCDDPERVKRAGENAFRDLWVTWDDAIASVVKRYEALIDQNEKLRSKA